MICEFVDRLHLSDVAPKPLARDARSEFALRFTGTENQNRLCIADAGDDLVIELIEMSHYLSLALALRHKVVGSVRVLSSQTSRVPRRYALAGQDLQHVLPVVRNQDDDRLMMVDP